MLEVKDGPTFADGPWLSHKSRLIWDGEGLQEKPGKVAAAVNMMERKEPSPLKLIVSRGKLQHFLLDFF